MPLNPIRATRRRFLSSSALLGASFVAPAALAQGTLRIGMTASDIPTATGLPNNGFEGMRFSLPNSRIMVHQPSGGYQGQATDIMIHARETEKLKRRLNEIYVRHTGNDYDTVEAALERDNFMSAEDAKAWGLIDEIVADRGKMDDTSK